MNSDEYRRDGDECCLYGECLFVMLAGNGSGSIKPFPCRAAYGSCVCMCVSRPAMSGDAEILLLWHAGGG